MATQAVDTPNQMEPAKHNKPAEKSNQQTSNVDEFPKDEFPNEADTVTKNHQQKEGNKKDGKIESETPHKTTDEHTTIEQTGRDTLKEEKPKIVNPYAKAPTHHSMGAEQNSNDKETEKDLVNKSTTPAKRNMHAVNALRMSSKKPRSRDSIHLLVEGYAFQDDIVGIAHRRSDGGEAYNLVLRNMLFNKELEDDGFSKYVALRDKSSGKEDKLLTNDNGYPRFLFLSINVHRFENTSEANAAVLEQCETFRSVSVGIFSISDC